MSLNDHSKNNQSDTDETVEKDDIDLTIPISTKKNPYPKIIPKSISKNIKKTTQQNYENTEKVVEQKRLISHKLRELEQVKKDAYLEKLTCEINQLRRDTTQEKSKPVKDPEPVEESDEEQVVYVKKPRPKPKPKPIKKMKKVIYYSSSEDEEELERENERIIYKKKMASKSNNLISENQALRDEIENIKLLKQQTIQSEALALMRKSNGIFYGK